MKQRFQEAGSGADFGLKFWVWATSSRSIFGDGGFGGVVGWGAVSEAVSEAVSGAVSRAVLAFNHFRNHLWINMKIF